MADDRRSCMPVIAELSGALGAVALNETESFAVVPHRVRGREPGRTVWARWSQWSAAVNGGGVAGAVSVDGRVAVVTRVAGDRQPGDIRRRLVYRVTTV